MLAATENHVLLRPQLSVLSAVSTKLWIFFFLDAFESLEAPTNGRVTSEPCCAFPVQRRAEEPHLRRLHLLHLLDRWMQPLFSLSSLCSADEIFALTTWDTAQTLQKHAIARQHPYRNARGSAVEHPNDRCKRNAYRAISPAAVGLLLSKFKYGFSFTMACFLRKLNFFTPAIHTRDELRPGHFAHFLCVQIFSELIVFQTSGLNVTFGLARHRRLFRASLNGFQLLQFRLLFGIQIYEKAIGQDTWKVMQNAPSFQRTNLIWNCSVNKKFGKKLWCHGPAFCAKYHLATHQSCWWPCVRFQAYPCIWSDN